MNIRTHSLPLCGRFAAVAAAGLLALVAAPASAQQVEDVVAYLMTLKE